MLRYVASGADPPSKNAASMAITIRKTGKMNKESFLLCSTS